MTELVDTEKLDFLEELSEGKVLLAGLLVLLTTGFLILKPCLARSYKRSKSKSALKWGAKYFSLFPGEHEVSPEAQFLKYVLGGDGGAYTNYTKKSVVKELREENPIKQKIPKLASSAVVESIKIGEVAVLKITAQVKHRNKNVVCIYCHDGKYVSGCAENYTALAFELSERLKMPVYLPNYRLLPENTLQDALEDMLDVLCGIGRNKLYILGGSGSGANLAFRTVRVAQKKKLRLPQSVFSISGALDGIYRLEPAGPKEMALISIYQDSFENEAEMLEEMEVYKYDVANFPSAWLCWDEEEKFTFECNRLFSTKLQENGIKFNVEETSGLFENTPHYFTENIPESIALLDSLQKHLVDQ